VRGIGPVRGRLRAAAVVGAVCLAGALAGCGAGSSGSEGKDKTTSTDPVVARGERLVEERACLSCHSTDGTRLAGPTWKGLAGSTVELADGRRVVADREYLRRAIQDPDAETIKGFPSGLMASVIKPGTVSDEDADAIAAYLETLR
jgi:cytochrome c oxidase subunit 2